LTTKTKEKWSYRPLVTLALLSFLVCGLCFPLLITSLAQLLFPYQANGEIIKLNGQNIGSNLIAQNFTEPVFFHPRDTPTPVSASGVDPDITLDDAYSQIPRIHNATNIPTDNLTSIVNQNEEGTLWIFGSPYVNVLRTNLELIRSYPSVYNSFP
jgi:K+-transporting ATPase ATPase C chain